MRPVSSEYMQICALMALLAEAKQVNAMRGVRCPARGKRDGFQGGQSTLIRAVIIHHPEFLVAGARADEGDLRGGNAGQAAGKFIDDFIGELMGEYADLRIRGSATIDLADNRFRGSAAHIVKPRGDDHLGGGLREIAESHEVGVERGVSPGKKLEFLGLRGNLRWIEAGRDELDDAGERQVVADDL